MTDNPYHIQITQNLPRVLSLFDFDRSSKSYGMGDRYHWAWGLIDFGNGSFQGAANGMAYLWKNSLWPYKTEKAKFLDRIDAMFIAAGFLTRKDGSLEEAFPREGSYCVTALVAFDLLCAFEQLESEITKQLKSGWLNIIKPMIDYLVKADETHAIISNHLATAVAALIRWKEITNDNEAEKKAHLLLNRIIKYQSAEGWFKEYDGADPGYQSLCTYYLADVHHKRPDLKLSEPLQKSVKFIWHFAHPDGSFGGIYGSRYTRFYYPAGFELLAEEIPEAAALADFMSESIKNTTVATLSSIDEPNIIPMFNAYCRAAVASNKLGRNQALPELPCKVLNSRIDFNEAGLIVEGGAKYYSIIGTFKGGVVMHFQNQALAVYNAGVVVKNPSGQLGSSQSYNTNNDIKITGDNIIIQSPIVLMPKQLPGPLDFLILRFLSLTFFRIPSFREWIKKLLVRLLITRKKTWPAHNTREIRFGYDLNVSDKLQGPAGYNILDNIKNFVAIHMASQGYWQIQDEIKE